MGEKPMVSHADAEASGDPPQQDREQERLPTEYEQGNQSANVKRHHKGASKPNDGLCKSPVVREDSRHPNTFPFCFDFHALRLNFRRGILTLPNCVLGTILLAENTFSRLVPLPVATRS
jgi:hypothetical protein